MINNCPIITIGMPVYNGEMFLAKAIASLLSQSCSDFELLISDNCSDDDTPNIIEKYRVVDSRIRVIRQSSQLSIIENFNFVVQKARGKYFMWAACDDEWDARWVERLLVDMNDPKVILSFGHLCQIDACSEIVKRYIYMPYGEGKKNQQLTYFFRHEMLGKASVIYGIYRTDFVRSFALSPVLGCLEGIDVHFVYHVLGYGKLKTNSDVLMYKRIPIGRGDFSDVVRKKNGWLRLRRAINVRRLFHFFCYVPISRGVWRKIIVFTLIPYKYFSLMKVFKRMVLRRWSF